MTRRLRPLRLLLWIAILLPLLGAAAFTWSSRVTTLREAQRSGVQSASIFREHALRVFEAQTNAIAEIDARTTGLSWTEIEQSDGVHRVLRAINDASPHIDGIWMVAPEGRTVNSADFFPMPNSIVVERDYFRALKERDIVFLGQVIQGRLKGNLNFNISRRRSSADGSFNGLILVTISLPYFNEFWSSVLQDGSAVAAIVREDGSTLARYPALDALPPSIPKNSPFFDAVMKSDTGRFEFTAGSDGKRRLYAFAKLGDFPAYAIVGLDRAAVLAPWRRQSAVVVALSALVAMALAGLVRWAERQQMRLTGEIDSRVLAEKGLRDSRAALQEREALYASVFRYNTDGLFVVHVREDGALLVEAINPAIELLMGQSSEAAAGHPLGEVVPEALLSLLEPRIRECVALGDPIRYERSFQFSSRRGTWLVTLVPIRDAAGRIVRVLGSNRDITAERDAETALRESRDRYSALFQHSPLDLAVIDVGPDGRFVYEEANPTLMRSLGFTAEAILGRTPDEVFAPELAATLNQRYRECADTSSLVEFEETARAPEGEVVRRSILVPVADETGKVRKIFVTAMDLTAQRQMEERLRQSQKMEVVGQLTGGIAHDFNNLLTVVMGNLDMLRRAKPERAPRLIDNALLAVEQGRRLTSQLLAFSRRQPLKPEVIDLGNLIRGMADMLTPSLRGDITLSLDIAADLWPVAVDPTQLQAAVLNLAANARDAMPRGGNLTVSVENRPPLEGGLEGTVRIAVSDTGAGIAPENLARVFEPFYTTKPIGHGTGLGLAQVYGFVRQSGGTVDIESEPGRGTTVLLFLPRAASAGEGAAAASLPAPSSTARAFRILVVEDNPQVAELAVALLAERGHSVERAASAPEALTILDGGAAFDLVFSDLVMPGGMDGLDLARAIRQRWPDLPVLLATGYSTEAPRALSDGFPLLAKPYEPSDLAAAVNAAVGHHAAPGTAVVTLRAG